MLDDEDDDDVIVAGTEGEGTEGQDPGEGDQEGDLPADQPVAEEDDGSGGEPAEKVAAEEPAKPSRGQARFQKLANDAKAARERAEKAEREIEELRRAQWQRDQQITEQQERERLALMTPDERADYRITQMERRNAEQLRAHQLQTAMHMDKAAFDAKATVHPIYARYKDEVEARFQDQLRKGAPVEREIILKNLLGERALDGALNGAGKAKAAGRKRIEAQKVAPGSSKGDAQSQRGKAGDTAEKRLQGVFI